MKVLDVARLNMENFIHQVTLQIRHAQTLFIFSHGHSCFSHDKVLFLTTKCCFTHDKIYLVQYSSFKGYATVKTRLHRKKWKYKSVTPHASNRNRCTDHVVTHDQLNVVKGIKPACWQDQFYSSF